jgi:hypothetical protein
MKIYTKSFIALFVTALFLFLSSCNRGTGCGTWGKNEYKKQHHVQTTKNTRNLAPYKGYN